MLPITHTNLLRSAVYTEAALPALLLPVLALFWLGYFFGVSNKSPAKAPAGNREGVVGQEKNHIT